MIPWGCVVLAAGKGTRMRSKIPKVMHPIAGREMILRVLDAAAQTRPHITTVVVGPDAPGIAKLVDDDVRLVTQHDRLGTGHALLQTRDLLNDTVEHILVINGDVPLISAPTLSRLMEHHLSSESAMTLLTCEVDGPAQLGRIVRNGRGHITNIVETAEATPQQRKIREICCGVYCFQSPWLWPELATLPLHPKGEYYLTDLVRVAHQKGLRVESVMAASQDEIIGINDRKDLARASSLAYQQVREDLMGKGITLLDPPSTFIDSAAQVGIDTVIHPNTTLRGSTTIGEDCQIGPHAVIAHSAIGNRCRVQGSVIEHSTLEDDVDVGPFCHIRNDAYLERHVHLGNYVEVKKSRLGQGTKVGHFSYLGDATLGANVNIGAGTVTCNYDGVKKNPTFIGEGAFIGCDSMLVAPVSIGARAVTGAGSVVTHDVPPDTLVVGVPARARRRVDSDRPADQSHE